MPDSGALRTFEAEARAAVNARDRCRVEAAASDSEWRYVCLLYTSDAADERSSVDLGGRRIIKKKTI